MIETNLRVAYFPFSSCRSQAVLTAIFRSAKNICVYYQKAVSQSVSQSISPSVSQSVSLSTSQAVYTSDKGLTLEMSTLYGGLFTFSTPKYQLVYQSVSRSIYQSIIPSIGQVGSQSASQSVNQSVAVCQLVHQQSSNCKHAQWTMD